MSERLLTLQNMSHELSRLCPALKTASTMPAQTLHCLPKNLVGEGNVEALPFLFERRRITAIAAPARGAAVHNVVMLDVGASLEALDAYRTGVSDLAVPAPER